MSKAYDRMECEFLQNMMIHLGFNNEWVGKIMACARSVNYHLVQKGEKIGSIKSSRGLCQGEPLSHLLFILCDEGLSNSIQALERQGRIPVLCRRQLLLLQRRYDEAQQVIKTYLLQYEKVLGQMINFHKSSITFSSNVPGQTKQLINNLLAVPPKVANGKHLGLPYQGGRNKKETFAYIKERISSRLRDWDKRLLSRAGKEILLKSIIQAIPSYVMSVFLLPSTFCVEIEIMNSF